MLNPATTPSDLATLLGTTYAKLCYTLYKRGTAQYYKSFTIAKKTGGQRLISAPKDALKILQLRLKPYLEELYEPHPAATAFITGRGIVYNAKPHVKKGLVFNVDLSNFYDKIHFGRIKGMLKAKPYSLQDTTSQIIAHMCCFNSQLPQGAPTSPVISNMICRRLDKELSHLAKKNHGFYTRYADDITISFVKIRDNEICKVVDEQWVPSDPLCKLITDHGFSLNSKKTRGEDFKNRQIVTGLKVNSIINIDRRYIRTTRAIIHSLSKGVDSANEYFNSISLGQEDSRLENVVAGRINFIGMVKGIDCSVYQTLARKFNELDIDITVPLRPSAKKENGHDELWKKKRQKTQERLNKCIWVVSFENIGGLTLDQSLVQGTAFMVRGQKIYTCNHTFEKAGNPTKCYLHRVYEPEKKFLATITNSCHIRDCATLSIIKQDKAIFESLEIYNKEDILNGYQVDISGFPQFLSGHSNAAITPATVVGHFKKSTIDHYEVNAEITGGYSGGPVLNKYGQVIGMVVMGKTVTHDPTTGESAIEGTNAFISSSHFL